MGVKGIPRKRRRGKPEVSRRSGNARAQHATVTDLLRSIGTDEGFVDSLEQRIASRQLVKQLVSLRAVRKVSQAEVAKRIGCSQSKISKLESSTDADLRMIDVVKYLETLGLTMEFLITARENTLVEQVKVHAFKIKALLDHLVEMADEDSEMAKGAADFITETMLNLAKMLSDCSLNLPQPERAGLFDLFEDPRLSAAAE